MYVGNLHFFAAAVVAAALSTRTCVPRSRSNIGSAATTSSRPSECTLPIYRYIHARETGRRHRIVTHLSQLNSIGGAVICCLVSGRAQIQIVSFCIVRSLQSSSSSSALVSHCPYRPGRRRLAGWLEACLLACWVCHCRRRRRSRLVIIQSMLISYNKNTAHKQ